MSVTTVGQVYARVDVDVRSFGEQMAQAHKSLRAIVAWHGMWGRPIPLRINGRAYARRRRAR